MNCDSGTKGSIIEVASLVRSFEEVLAVNEISFSIKAGQVVGFIGANGAGKTTTMRVMATLDMPDSGVVKIAGYNVTDDPQEIRRLLGWMPDAFGVYEHTTVLDYLDFHARAHGYNGCERRKRIDEVMQFADLTGLAERPMNGLSKGMGQRLCLGRTLIHDPQVLILDEPAAGLDPKARIEFKNLVRLLADQNKTIFISSHILSELGEMCDEMLFIEKGEIVHHGSAESLKRNNETNIEVEIATTNEAKKLSEWLQVNKGWKKLGESKNRVRASYESQDDHDLAGELRRMVNEGIRVYELKIVERRLEDAFVDILKRSTMAEDKES
ncbi:MAG: ABC transporter ATP-binding protein [Verrucomicrobiota bacterium]